MNLDNFHDFLDEPSNLHRVSYQELKSLVAAYPFSTNLRILLLLKSKFDKHPDLSRNLILAATYTSDRSLLHKIMHSPMLQMIPEEQIEEEVLELMDLEKVEAIMSKEQPSELPKASAAVSAVQNNPPWATEIFNESNSSPISPETTVVSLDSLLNDVGNDNEIEDLTTKTSEENEYRQKVIKFSVDNFIGVTIAVEKLNFHRKPPIEIVNKKLEPQRYSYNRKLTPLPKDSFASWLVQFEKDLNRELDTPEIEQTIEKVEATKIIKVVEEQDEEVFVKKKKLSTKKEAEKSLHLNNTIVSETLAELLVKQERFDKAIEMYRKLGLKYPEKSHIFAAQIKKIKNL